MPAMPCCANNGGYWRGAPRMYQYGAVCARTARPVGLPVYTSIVSCFGSMLAWRRAISAIQGRPIARGANASAEHRTSFVRCDLRSACHTPGQKPIDEGADRRRQGARILDDQLRIRWLEAGSPAPGARARSWPCSRPRLASIGPQLGRRVDQHDRGLPIACARARNDALEAFKRRFRRARTQASISTGIP